MMNQRYNVHSYLSLMISLDKWLQLPILGAKNGRLLGWGVVEK